MSKARLYGLKTACISNAAAGRRDKHRGRSYQNTQQKKGDLFRQALRKKMEEKNG